MQGWDPLISSKHATLPNAGSAPGAAELGQSCRPSACQCKGTQAATGQPLMMPNNLHGSNTQVPRPLTRSWPLSAWRVSLGQQVPQPPAPVPGATLPHGTPSYGPQLALKRTKKKSLHAMRPACQPAAR